jgi:xanthine dehydrogenase accessory factor
VKPEILSALNAERAARQPCILVTTLSSGAARLIRSNELATDAFNGTALGEALAEGLRSGKSGIVEIEGDRLFLKVQVPPVRLVAVGAVHISQALVPFARELNLDMTVIDPRLSFATPERFPDVTVLAEWPDIALPPLKLDRYTAFVALTHDPKIDDPGLDLALQSECFYVGALGSRKTHARRVERLREKGFSDEAIARIRAPIGLDIGAVSPAEIALSIAGEIVAAMRTKRRAA